MCGEKDGHECREGFPLVQRRVDTSGDKDHHECRVGWP